MEHAHDQQPRAHGGEDRPLQVPARRTRPRAEPRDALDDRHESKRSGEDPHARHSTLRSQTWWPAIAAAALVCTAGALAYAAPHVDHGGERLSPLLAIFLGVIQGLTEFLPVSSSGHLSLAQAWLGIDPNVAGHRFNITVHAGTLIAVVWVYRKDIGELFHVLRSPSEPSEARTRLLMMLLASLPLGIVLLPGVEDLVIAMESQVRIIGFALWTTAAILFFGFRQQRPVDPSAPAATAPPLPWQAFAIGCAQVVAVLPGISRSGTTIAAGIAVGLPRASAARFSFLISLIAVGGASGKELLSVLADPSGGPAIDPLPFALGFLASLVVGLASLRALLFLVGRGSIGGFVVYLSVLGAIAIFVG